MTKFLSGMTDCRLPSETRDRGTVPGHRLYRHLRINHPSIHRPVPARRRARIARVAGSTGIMSAVREVVDGVFELSLGFVNVHVVVTDDGVVLIDTGLPRRSARIEKALLG